MGATARSPGRWVPVALVPVAVAYGIVATSVAARHGELTTYADISGAVAAAQLGAGWALIAAGLLIWQRRPDRPTGPLAVTAGALWFAPDWIGWQLGPGSVRILALATQGVAAVAVMQLALATARGNARWLGSAVWAAAVLATLARVLFYDPLADPHCVAYCAPNPLYVAGRFPRALDWAEASVAALAGVAVLAPLARVARGPAATRSASAAIVLPAVAFTGAWAWRAIASAVTPGDDPRRPVLVATFALRAVALVALAAGLLWALSRARRSVAALRRLARAAAREPAAGSLQSALIRATGDASLRVAFPSGDGWIDAGGEPVAIAGAATVSMIAREGRPIAGVVHEPGTLDPTTLERELGAAAQMAVDNERLRAKARAHLRELKESRARIVETSDRERRRLERDLHDGAQQRLVGLSVAMAMTRDAFEADADATATLAETDVELHQAIADLRDLARGIHPVELSEEGLAAALESLADDAPVAIDIDGVPEARFAGAVEAAGYMLVDEILRLLILRSGDGPLTVTARHAGDALTLTVHDPGAQSAAELLTELVDVADRVSALDGRLHVHDSAAGGVDVTAEMPCG